VLQGEARFYELTKAVHNALHGRTTRLTPEDLHYYDEIMDRNASLVEEPADLVVIHDPQPAGLVRHRPHPPGNWLWRCHIDLSEADPTIWRALRPVVEEYDGAVFHQPSYTKDLMVPQYILPPAIDPLSPKNEEIPPAEAEAMVAELGIDPELPVVLQVSRFDRLKDPLGVIDAFEMASGWERSQLVLAGGAADDDPEGSAVYAEVQERAAEVANVHVLNLPPDSHRTINALQRTARVVVQKSVKEGFGLVVSEAMWKEKPVIGNAVGGIREQIIHGLTGFLVHSTEGMAYRIRQLLTDPELSASMGRHARENVRLNYLMPGALKRWLLLFLAQRNGGQGVTFLDAT
jgi:trehalose synthase